jgi:nucleoside-diphosphate-sugar epimerase
MPSAGVLGETLAISFIQYPHNVVDASRANGAQRLVTRTTSGWEVGGQQHDRFQPSGPQNARSAEALPQGVGP